MVARGRTLPAAFARGVGRDAGTFLPSDRPRDRAVLPVRVCRRLVGCDVRWRVPRGAARGTVVPVLSDPAHHRLRRVRPGRPADGEADRRGHGRRGARRRGRLHGKGDGAGSGGRSGPRTGVQQDGRAAPDQRGATSQPARRRCARAPDAAVRDPRSRRGDGRRPVRARRRRPRPDRRRDDGDGPAPGRPPAPLERRGRGAAAAPRAARAATNSSRPPRPPTERRRPSVP